MILADKVLVGLLMAVHPFFISMTDVKYNKGTQTIELSVRIFTDDFEKTLSNQCRCEVDLNQPGSKETNDKLIVNYIASHLQLVVDGKRTSLEFVGRQPEDGSTWNYFEIKNVASLNTLAVTNTLLYDYKPEQINMVHIKANGKDRTDKLEYPARVITF